MRISKQNAGLNGVTHKVRSVLVPADRVPGATDLPCYGEYDIVVANILQGPLLELKSVFLAGLKIGGKLGLSGILAAQAEDVAAVYKSGGEVQDVRGAVNR